MRADHVERCRSG